MMEVSLKATGIGAVQLVAEAAVIDIVANALYPYFQRNHHKDKVFSRVVVKRSGNTLPPRDAVFDDWGLDRVGSPIKKLVGEAAYLHRQENVWQLTTFGSNVVNIQVDSDDIQALATAAIRAVYISAVKELRQLGSLHIHGSSACWNNRAVTFLGDKGSGKTTSLLYALRRRWKFISNDQILLSPSGFVFGIPMSARIRSSTLPLFDELACFGSVTNETLKISPNELAQAFSTEVVPRAKGSLFIVVQRDRYARRAVLEEVNETKQSEIMRASEIDFISPQQSYWEGGSNSSLLMNNFRVLRAMFNDSGIGEIFSQLENKIRVDH